MNPTYFIQKHIIARLVAEGFPEQVAADAADTGVDHYRRMSQASRKGGERSMIACIAPVSGQPDRRRQQNGRQRKSRESVVEGTFPACSDLHYIPAE